MRNTYSITHRRAFAGISAIAALAALANPASVAAQTTVLYACYVPSSGTVYRIKEPGLQQQCGSSMKKGVTVQHVEFSWSDGQSGPGGADHGALTGLGDDDHPQYLLTDGARTSLDGFAVQGTWLQGGIPASGAGVRLMWYPAKAALRAGKVQGTQWDDANVGTVSVALGSDVIASGTGSVAIGNGAIATEAGAVALGAGAKATGNAAVALGRASEASNIYAFAAGNSSRATGTESIVMGSNSTAAGGSSTAIGNNVRSSGFGSLAFGNQADTNLRAGAIVMSTRLNFGVPVKAVADNQFVVRASRFWFGNNENVTAHAGQLIATSTGAYLTTGGAWVNSSDVNRKDNFQAVDGEIVLGTLAAMPIQTWNYRDEDAAVRHMGPTAQDFRTAFGLGASETAIATVDADGVSLAAIQALAQRTAELKSENDALRLAVAELRDGNADLHGQLIGLVARIERIERGADRR